MKRIQVFLTALIGAFVVGGPVYFLIKEIFTESGPRRIGPRLVTYAPSTDWDAVWIATLAAVLLGAFLGVLAYALLRRVLRQTD
ncbi:MAG: hypothetical protein Q8R28_19055 [Dehalococcoidia bacterium]|nr:hypothetical protein [Dehalococcoidia bacterium]